MYSDEQRICKSYGQGLGLDSGAGWLGCRDALTTPGMSVPSLWISTFDEENIYIWGDAHN